jgi:hypothetical protein
VSYHTEPMTPAQIWKELSVAQRFAAAEALWDDPDSAPQQADAVQAIARQLHFRPQSVLKLAPERRARQLAGIRSVSETLASRALVVYHLAAHRPMLEAFLDQLEIAHEGGMIADGAKEPPAPERLEKAVAALAATFPAADVRTYLHTLAAQDPDIWAAVVPMANALIPS